MTIRNNVSQRFLSCGSASSSSVVAILANKNKLICFLFLHITTYYARLIYTRGFELAFTAEGDVGTFDINRLFLAINFDGHSEKKLQPFKPDIFWLSTNRFRLGGEWRRSPLCYINGMSYWEMANAEEAGAHHVSCDQSSTSCRF